MSNTQHTLTEDQALDILNMYGCREHAVQEGEAHDWDEAYSVAYGAYLDRAPMRVNGQEVW